MGINLFLVMFRNSTITDLFLFVFTQLILHYQLFPSVSKIFMMINLFTINCAFVLSLGEILERDN
ncbi:hypothetical protein DK182_02710 [Streptococcus sobrinus]|uniref:Uncharacterized protein n=1 Tax=Streptococcus sobrinus TaxID=1310 RepID=A0ABM6W639_9STRE|nr:hypothetical protein DK182_02710 [Streptococcus sobrinus]